MSESRLQQQAEQLRRHQEEQARLARLQQMGVQGDISVNASEWEVHRSKSARPHQPIVSRRPGSSFPVRQPQKESKDAQPGDYKDEPQLQHWAQETPIQLQGNVQPQSIVLPSVVPYKEEKYPQSMAAIDQEVRLIDVENVVSSSVKQTILTPLDDLISCMPYMPPAYAQQLFEALFEAAVEEYTGGFSDAKAAQKDPRNASQNVHSLFNKDRYLNKASSILNQVPVEARQASHKNIGRV